MSKLYRGKIRSIFYVAYDFLIKKKKSKIGQIYAVKILVIMNYCRVLITHRSKTGMAGKPRQIVLQYNVCCIFACNI